MNWVGGARNRLMMKDDAKKQKEFFERNKMQRKRKNLGLPVPSSPRGSTTASVDLVTLFVVNQIAAKKELKDPPTVGVVSSNRKRGSTQWRKEPLVLPMSPGSPSQLVLVESRQQQNSLQVTRKRKQVIPPGFKCQQLSPVLESAFSDNSATDYVPAIVDPLSPFSSTSPASSGQGRFPLHLNLQQRGPPSHRAPLPWDTPAPEQTLFQPFSLPRGLTDASSWSSASSSAFYCSEMPPDASSLFGGPASEETHSGVMGQEVAFSLQSMDEEPMFSLSQEQSELHFQQDVFRGFSDVGFQVADSFGPATNKMYLRDETPAESSTPQSVPQPQCIGAELSSSTDTNFSCPGPGLSVNGCNYSPSYCCGGYLSSDSSEDEDGCQPGEGGCCAAAAANQIPTSQGDQKQSRPQPSPLTPLIKLPVDYQKIVENKTIFRSGGGARVVSPPPQSEPCRCKKASGEARDAGTQTDAISSRKQTRHVATQCALLSDPGGGGDTHPRRRSPPVGVSSQRSATGGQAGHTDAAAMVVRGGTPTHTPRRQRLAAGVADAGRRPGDGGGQGEATSVMTKATLASGVCRLSDEAETLQEIADILLLLKQRRKEE